MEGQEKDMLTIKAYYEEVAEWILLGSMFLYETYMEFFDKVRGRTAASFCALSFVV